MKSHNTQGAGMSDHPRLYRDTFTVTRKADGTFSVKLHGYPFFYTGTTAQEAMSAAGDVMDATLALRAAASTTGGRND